jgi:hypothetical protein
VTLGFRNEWLGNRKYDRDREDDNNNTLEDEEHNNNNNISNSKHQEGGLVGAHQSTIHQTPRAIGLWPKYVGAKRHYSSIVWWLNGTPHCPNNLTS